VYARLSKVASTGDLEKCEYQTELCKSYAASRGIPVGNLLQFADPSLSAWKKGVARPQWDEMMALAARGQEPGHPAEEGTGWRVPGTGVPRQCRTHATSPLRDAPEARRHAGWPRRRSAGR
jgi:hypothetical protein